MNDVQRHGEVMGALGRIDAKLDSHGDAIESHTKDIARLNAFKSKTKGVAIAVSFSVAVLAAIGTVVAKAKELF